LFIDYIILNFKKTFFYLNFFQDFKYYF